MGKFVIKKATTGEYYFNLLADNSQIILTSLMYSLKISCFNGIDFVRNSCVYGIYEPKQTSDHKHYFVLYDSQGQIVGTSELFSSIALMEAGIESVKVNGNNIKAVEEEPYF